jgi:prepilin-type N-terminal cleavage/methylation domain-containing protein
MKRPAYTARSGFTLLELMFSMGIGSIIALVTLGALVEGMHLFSSNSTEMVARDQGSRAIRQIATDIQSATLVNIYPDYTSTTGSSASYGTCAVVAMTTGTVAYYRYASTTGTNAGGIYYCSNAAVPPNPATDKLLVSSVQDFEFRADVYASIRVGFKIGIYGYPSLLVGSKEADLVRFTTSATPRNL